MRNCESNPPRNKVPQGIKVDEFIRAIELSGYPLQGLTAEKLLSEFRVIEEWGYIDPDSDERRTLDVLASKPLSDDDSTIVQPGLILLIECKRSEHPYVFFQTVTDRDIPRFPLIAGLKNDIVSIAQRDGNRSQDCAGAYALGLNILPFVQAGPPHCCAFSKAQPSGTKVRLSGSDPFNNLILPLIKASDYAFALFRAHQPASHLFPRLLLCLSVLDAPMILVESPSMASDPILTPWVRVSRQEASRDKNGRVRHQHYAIDVVHIDFLETYVSDEVLPFAHEFAQRVMHKEGVLLGGGTVASLENWTWDEVEPK